MNSKAKIRAVVFDFGFTLFYFKDVSMERYMDCYKRGLLKSVEFLKKKNILKDDAIIEKFVRTFNKTRASNFKKMIKTRIEIPTFSVFRDVLKMVDVVDLDEDTCLELANLYHSIEEEEWIPFETTRETLKKLSQLEGFKLAVLSNHSHHDTIINLLKKHDLFDFFDIVVTSAKFGKRKPDPEIFYHVLEKMGLQDSPSSCIICGDEYADIYGGHRAGLQTVLCERTYKFPFEKEIPVKDYLKIKNISELLDQVK